MASRARVRRTALAVGAALLLPVGVAQAAPAGDDTTGSRGIGDPYYPTYGNGGYDVDHYGIHIHYTPKTDKLVGRTVIKAHAMQELSRFNLDFVLPVKSVKVNGQKAAYTQGKHELVVTPRDALHATGKMEVEVRYAGVPGKIRSEGIKPWIRTDDGVAAVGEPEIAAWWYPANDHPRDKATYDVSVTAAKSLEVLGNGILVSNKAKKSHRTWHWRETKPMAPYLAFFVVGQFDITKSRVDGLPVITAVASNGGSEGRYAAADLKKTPAILRWEAKQYGPYPFDAMGGVAPAADFGFALENQTRPVYTRGFWSQGHNIYVAVHELAHQWYGDSVSVHNWKDIWLNEGFATFFEHYFSETHGGQTAQHWLRSTYDGIGSDDGFWHHEVADPCPDHVDCVSSIFDGFVYQRGGLTLQALRNVIGDDDFFTLLQRWAADREGTTGNTDQLQALAEEISGQDLDGFFDAWLHSPTKPADTVANGLG